MNVIIIVVNNWYLYDPVTLGWFVMLKHFTKNLFAIATGKRVVILLKYIIIHVVAGTLARVPIIVCVLYRKLLLFPC